MKPRVEAELQRLVNVGVLTPVDRAEFSTTPLVAVPKPNGAVRLCGDFKMASMLISMFNNTRCPLSPKCYSVRRAENYSRSLT